LVNLVNVILFECSDVTRNFLWVCSTNSVEDRGQRERGSVDDSLIVRSFAQFANEWSRFLIEWLVFLERGIRLSFVKT
jgi:hypothetical protein